MIANEMRRERNQQPLYLRPKRKLTLLVLIVSSFLSSFVPTVGSQTNRLPLTDAEAKQAQQVSTAFMKRLGETLDFGIVMNELFLPDAAERYVANENRKAAANKSPYVIIWPGMFVDARALETASVADWRRLYVATANFILLGFVRIVRTGNLQTTSPADFYSREVIKLVDRNPLLRNFIQKKDVLRHLESADEMRSAAATLEQANAMLRKEVPSTPNLEELIIDAGVRSAGKTSAVSEQDFERARSKMMSAEMADGEMLGFPKGTRLIIVMTFSAHGLVLVKVGDALKIAWVFPFTG